VVSFLVYQTQCGKRSHCIYMPSLSLQYTTVSWKKNKLFNIFNNNVLPPENTKKKIVDITCVKPKVYYRFLYRQYISLYYNNNNKWILASCLLKRMTHCLICNMKCCSDLLFQVHRLTVEHDLLHEAVHQQIQVTSHKSEFHDLNHRC
jgi:hypothetical protein